MALYTPELPAISESVATRAASAPSFDSDGVDPLAKPSRARLLCFLLVGGLATGAQLALLALLLRLGWSAILANAVALLTSTQVNFALNACVTWSDRWDAAARGARLIASRWLRFMGAAAGTLLLNEACYTLLRHALPALVAAGLCSAAIALLNYFLGDRLIFAPRRSAATYTPTVAAR